MIYSFRDNLPFVLTSKADRYCVPLFHQNWKLFAPDLPKYNVELEYRRLLDGQWGDWYDASSAHGFGISSRIETVEQGFNSALGWQVLNNLYEQNDTIQFDRVIRSNAYASALYFVLKLEENCNQDTTKRPIQLRLRYRFAPDPGTEPLPVESSLEFPIYVPQI